MRRLSALTLFLCLLTPLLPAQSEKKDFSLKQAVMRPFGFSARKLAALQWHPNGQSVTCFKRSMRGAGLVRIDAKSGKETVILAAKEVKEIAKESGVKSLSLGSLMGATWSEDGASLRFVQNGQLYHLHLASKKLSRGLKIPGTAEASTWAKGDVYAAYSEDKNVFVKKPDGSTFQVTEGGYEFLTHGLSVSRVEFGITDGMWWDPTGRRLAFYREDLRPIEESPLIDWKSRPAQNIKARYPMAGRPGSIVTVGVYDTRNDRVTWLKTDTSVDQYLTNVTWDPKGETLYIAHVNRGQNTMDLKTWDAKTGAFKAKLFTEKDEQWIEPEHGPMFLPNDTGDFLWFSYRGGFHNLYLCSNQGSFMQRVTNGDWDVSAFQGFSDDGKLIYYLGAGETPTESHLFSSPLMPESALTKLRQGDNQHIHVVKELPKKLTAGGGQHDAKISPGGRYVLDSHSQLNQSVKVEIINLDTNKSVVIQRTKNPWDKYRHGHEELFTTKAQDGSTLYGHIILPPDLDESKKYPVLLYVYGGPHAQLVKDEFGGGAGFSSPWFHYMANQGIIVMRIDGHGTPQRGIEFMQAIHRKMGTIEIQDQIAGLEYLFKRPYVDRNRVGVHGWSYGGFMTLSLMTRAGDYFKCGISGAPVTDWSYYETGYGERYMDTPEENPEGYKEAMPANHLNGLKGRLLVVQGSSDVTVVWQHTIAFLSACIEQDKPVEYMTYPGQPHGLRGPNRWHFYQKMTKFFLEELND